MLCQHDIGSTPIYFTLLPNWFLLGYRNGTNFKPHLRHRRGQQMNGAHLCDHKLHNNGTHLKSKIRRKAHLFLVNKRICVKRKPYAKYHEITIYINTVCSNEEPLLCKMVTLTYIRGEILDSPGRRNSHV